MERVGYAEGELEKQIDQALQSVETPSDLVRVHNQLGHQWVQQLEKPSAGDLQARLRNATGLLHSQPDEIESLGQLAREAGLSAFHFSRLFKKRNGLGFARARLEAKIAKARRLLSDSQISLAAVSAECGFKNSSYFSTVFKRLEGVSPRDFRSKINKLK